MYFSPRKTTLKFSEEWGKSHRGMGKELRELKCAMGKELSIEGVIALRTLQLPYYDTILYINICV